MNKANRFIAAAAAAALVFGMAIAPGRAQDKRSDRRDAKIEVRTDVDRLERDIEKALVQIDLLRGLRVRVRGKNGFRLDVDLSGIRDMVRDLERMGKRCESERRELTRAEKRELRKALRKLEDLDIDLDLDFDFDIK